MNLPNKISLSRIFLIFVVVFFFFATFINNGINYYISAGIFVLAAYTDALDGHIARKYNLITNLGKFLDSIADKLLANATLILLACSGLFDWQIGAGILLVIISRDFIIDMLRQVGASKNVVIAADWFGKIKAIVMDIALPILLVAKGLSVVMFNSLAFNIVFYFGFVLLLISTLLSILSAVNYLVKNRKVFKD